jgi:FG-GAP-like repeat
MSKVKFALFLLSALPLQGFTGNTGHTFSVLSYGGKCLDFGPPPQVTGGPVFIYGCNGTISQQIRVVEPDASPAGQHKVILFAGTKVIGVKGNIPASGAALELQDQNSSSGQIFQLDGDSIISAANRSLVVQVQNNRGANRTPLILAARELKDAEFWTFSAVDGSSAFPTSGFVSLPTSTTMAQLTAALQNASFGSVLILDGQIDLTVSGTLPLIVNAGVTLRSNRRLTDLGARLTWSKNAVLKPGSDSGMVDARADSTRVTGMRFAGPSITIVQTGTPTWDGILADDAHPCIVDHNELYGWTISGVGTTNYRDVNEVSPQVRAQPVHIVRNFIHHNEMDNYGYGVVTGHGSFPLIQGNTFLLNRHAIASDGSDFAGYIASSNLVLSSVPGYPATFTTLREQDFDMHGTGSSCGQHCGGSAGQYMDIGGNTFLGDHLTLSTHYSFYLRGTPSFEALFHNNIVHESQGDAIKNEGPPAKLVLGGNQFGAEDPTGKLAVGDFDGDGKDDLFLATGAAWYYSPAGKVDWRFLNAQTDPIGSLLFGDFDGDGRTDVFKLQGNDWLVSWGGASPWEKINQAPVQLVNLAIGDFDGDGRADIFYSDGHSWFVSSGGTGPLTMYQTSTYRVADLRFGDFNHDGKTGVFGTVSGKWQVSYGAKSSWTALRCQLTSSAAGLMIGDFDGDGKSDIALLQNGSLKVSSGGTSDWITYSTFSNSLTAVGRFQSHARSDLLIWDGNYLNILAGGKLPFVRQAPENMR